MSKVLHCKPPVQILWEGVGASMERAVRLCWARVYPAEAATAEALAACLAKLVVLPARLEYTLLYSINVALTLSQLNPIWVSRLVAMKSNGRRFSRLEVCCRPFDWRRRRNRHHRVYRSRKNIRLDCGDSGNARPCACAAEAGQKTSRFRRRLVVRSNGSASGAEGRRHGQRSWQPGDDTNPCFSSCKMFTVSKRWIRMQI